MRFIHLAAFVCVVASVWGTKGDNIVQLAKKLGANTLLTLATEAGLADTLANGGPFTVFGPTDEAFSKLPKDVLRILSKNKQLLADVLKYHVVSGTTYSSQLTNELLAPSLLENEKIRFNIYQNGKVITAEGSPVIAADQNATNGVIHVVNRVLFPIPRGNIVQVVARQPDLKTLVTAVTAAGLVNTLSGDGPFTVFAPTDEAFKKLPPGTLEKLLANKTALTDVLTYHVVGATEFSAGLANGESAPTVEGKNIQIKISDAGVMINNAKVLRADEACTNGVVHVIDSVLLPPSFTDANRT